MVGDAVHLEGEVPISVPVKGVGSVMAVSKGTLRVGGLVFEEY